MANLVEPCPRLPSQRWKSYEGWDEVMKDRLVGFMATITKEALVKHVREVTGREVGISDAFSAGEHWACFELVVSDGRVIMARVKLPPHPHTSGKASVEAQLYTIECEVAALKFLHARAPNVRTPKLYAYEEPSSARAVQFGAAYMLIEGFRGNTLDLNFLELQAPDVEKIMRQWTVVQAELASFSFPTIGSISAFSDEDGATIGSFCCAEEESYPFAGPLIDAVQYFIMFGQATLTRARERIKIEDHHSIYFKLAPYIFLDIVKNTNIYKGSDMQPPFHLNHMDMGPHNVLVDDDHNLLAVIDWEFVRSVPWAINTYPGILSKLFPPTVTFQQSLQMERQESARELYRRLFREAEEAIEARGTKLGQSIADTLDSLPSKILVTMERVSAAGVAGEVVAVMEIVRLAFGVVGEEARIYCDDMAEKMLAEERLLDM